MGRDRIAVIHLARHANGPAPLKEFLQSYFERPAGVAHDLVVLLKGYAAHPGDRDAALGLLRSVDATSLEIPDEGLDLDAYRAACTKLEHCFFCFLNSFSRFCSEHWLEKLMHWAERPGVGIVGATGSYESIATDEIHAVLQAVRKVGRRQAAPVQEERVGTPAAPRVLRVPVRLWRAWRTFPLFPNHHIRTNGFLLSSQVMRQLYWPKIDGKLDAYRVESGRQGITAQVGRLGLEPVVVGRDGQGFFRHEWHCSGTFWQSAQENLLIDDNQTRDYESGSARARKLLADRAWRGIADAGQVQA